MRPVSLFNFNPSPDTHPEDSWRVDAACKGDRRFIADPTQGVSWQTMLEEVKHICETCHVRPQCLDAGRDEPAGIWGGTTPVTRSRYGWCVECGVRLQRKKKNGHYNGVPPSQWCSHQCRNRAHMRNKRREAS